MTYTDSQWKDLLTAVNGQTITYDAIGNPTNYYDGSTMDWAEGRRLQSVTQNGQTHSYQYNADGLRTKKTNADGSYIVYHIAGSRYLGEIYYTATGAVDLYIRYNYDENGSVVGISLWNEDGSAWTDYYFEKNLQGDILNVYQDGDSLPTLVASYTYDAWGNILTSTGSLADLNPFRYRGYYYDAETGLYYVSSRYYDPEIGRFINADGAYDTNQGVLGYNMYAYCLNNPVNMYDPDGRCSRFLGFLWKIDCKQASCPESKNYVKPKAIDPIGLYNKGQGYVYVVTEDQLDIMEEREKNVVVIVDKRTSSDPNMQIQDSYRITKTKQQKEIAQLMLNYNTSNPVEPVWSRTLDSLVEEWKLHNFACNLGYKQERTGDCDFNNADEGMGFWDFVGR